MCQGTGMRALGGIFLDTLLVKEALRWLFLALPQMGSLLQMTPGLCTCFFFKDCLNTQICEAL
jgi:uncharacterized protein YqcC (DUF446 family)